MDQISPAEKKLRRARTMLILGDGDEPFFGSVAIGLDLVPQDTCKTAATDGKNLWYNPAWIEGMEVEEAMALFEHEVFHVALKHGKLVLEIIDEPDFDLNIWQIACDFPINSMLLAKGRKLPLAPGGQLPMVDPKYDGMSAIRIYRKLLNEKKALQSCDGKSQPGSGVPEKTDGKAPPQQDSQKGDQGPPDMDSQDKADKSKDFIEQTGSFGGIMPMFDEKDNLVSQKILDETQKNFEMTIMNSARVLEKSLESDVGDMPGFVTDIIKAHTEPQRTYKDDLLDIMEEITRDDYNWGKPNKKYDIYMPSLYDKKLAELVVIVDSSGSVSQNELRVYAGEISGLLEEFEEIEVHVIFHHTQAYNVETYQSSDLPVSFGNIRSGGTCYKDAYARISYEGYDPKALLHFTDLDVKKHNYPEVHPDFPVFWMNTSPRKANGALKFSRPPFGQVIDLDPYA